VRRSRGQVVNADRLLLLEGPPRSWASARHSTRDPVVGATANDWRVTIAAFPVAREADADGRRTRSPFAFTYHQDRSPKPDAEERSYVIVKSAVSQTVSIDDQRAHPGTEPSNSCHLSTNSKGGRRLHCGEFRRGIRR
jgi:hypothetical protein